MQKLSRLIYFIFLFLVVSFFLINSKLNEVLPVSAQTANCGDLNEPCCDNNECNDDNLQCLGRFCKIPVDPPKPNCGDLNEPCCDNNECNDDNLQCLGRFCKIADDTTSTTNTSSDAFPGIKFPCDDVNNPEFHSLRPYQGAHCGDAGKALYCSNEIQFIESFDLTSKCPRNGNTSDFVCNVDVGINPHNLFIELTDSMFPIMGNTEQVKNSQGGTEEFSDAQKLNEYASWYLSGVTGRAEYGVPTDDQIVNYSGPVKKLLPQMIQESERINTINKAVETDVYYDEDAKKDIKEVQNHDQIVVCSKEEGLGKIGDILNIGKTKPTPCYEEGDEHRLSEWLDDLSIFNGLINRLGADAWNKRTPPLPWSDENGEPFKTQAEYQKAYREWRGGSCITIPLIEYNFCLENPFVPNKWAELYQYIPLSNTTDKKGANYIMGDGPDVQAGSGTEISFPNGTQFEDIRNAPLYFAHTQEVKELSEVLNKTYTPQGYESEPVPQTTEKNECSAVNVRVNPGDNLFPGDPDEMQVIGVQYNIDQVLCKVTETTDCDPEYDLLGNKIGCTIEKKYKHHCNAEVYITLHTGTKTPNADEIFANTVADSGSTFRKIFPKVDENAPVTCIADIPTVTDVKYDPSQSQKPRGDGITGSQKVKITRYPEDGAGGGTQLTFPHVGSIYEYFLKGIQTALRPQGFGDTIISGELCTNVACGELPELPKANGSCNLGGISSRIGDIPQSLKDIVSAAAETYKVPPNLILGIMFGESRFNRSDKNDNFSNYDWTEENVKDWATCVDMPNCHSIPYVYNAAIAISEDNWSRISEGIKDDIKKLDPNREINGCNLLDSIYGIAWLLRDNVDGGPFEVSSCFGVNLNKGNSTAVGCDWTDADYITAIKVNESGWTNMCFTKEYSCRDGGGRNAACPTGGDTCETIDNRYSSLATSHMGCVFDVANGK